MIDKNTVLNKLKEIYEPCLPIIDIVDMGLIYDIKIEDENVYVLMTFTTPHCPAGFRMVETVKKKIKEIESVKNIDVELTFNPPWTKERLSQENRVKLGFI